MLRIPVLEQIDSILEDLSKGGEEIPSVAMLGIKAYQDLMGEMKKVARYTGYSDANPGYLTEMQYMTAHGAIWVKQSPDLPLYHVSVGSRTIDDIIAESILLGESYEA